MRSSPLRGASTPTAGSSSSGLGIQSAGMIPLVDCPVCGIPVVRIKSKQRDTLDQIFIKCPNNFKGDPETCGFIMSEKQYHNYILKMEKRQAEQKMFHLDGGEVEGAFGSAGGMCSMRQELDEVKQKVDSLVTEVWKMKLQLEKQKMEYFVIGAMCVGVVLGLLLKKMWK